MAAEPTEQQRSLDLLNAVHTFPGPFAFRVVVRPGSEDAVVAAMRAAVHTSDPPQVHTRPSSKGTYLSVRVTLTLDRAEEVLDVYGSLKTVDGVVTVF